jgi:hypothetical protein
MITLADDARLSAALVGIMRVGRTTKCTILPMAKGSSFIRKANSQGR